MGKKSKQEEKSKHVKKRNLFFWEFFTNI